MYHSFTIHPRKYIVQTIEILEFIVSNLCTMHNARVLLIVPKQRRGSLYKKSKIGFGDWDGLNTR